MIVASVAFGCAIITLSASYSGNNLESKRSKEQDKELDAYQRGTYTPSPEYTYFWQLLRGCGDLCKLGAGTFSPSLFFEKRAVSVNCSAIFGSDVFIQRGHGELEAPSAIPAELISEFTMEGKVEIKSKYSNQIYLAKDAKTSRWSSELVDEKVALAALGKLEGNYGTTETNYLRRALRRAPGISGGRVLVIGSENPWVEACVLEAGASSVVTLEYGKIYSEHARITTLTPIEFQHQFLAGELGTFDSIVTFSSVEHSGLGRYGDALNPWGDVLEIARASCVCRAGGSLVLAVMCGNSHCTQDMMEFNLHRKYGSLRWPYLASNWDQVYRVRGGKQRCHVFVKP